jgi:hypothetical protein
MQKYILNSILTICSVAIATTVSAISVNAQTADEYIDSTSPQVIEKIAGNIVTFKNITGESHNYYVPNWMFDKYNLQVGSSASLYNRNIVQGIYRDKYLDVASPSLLNVNTFALHDTRSDCLISESHATEGLASGKRVWFKTLDCPSTIPIVGSMSFYKPKAIASIEQ